MTRGITAAMQTAAAGPIVRPAYLVEMNFDSGTERVWSGVGPITWDSQVWGGVGEFGYISAVAEAAGPIATGIVLGLSFNDANLLSIALTEEFQRRTVNVWQMLFGEDLAAVDDPIKIFGGLMDKPTIKRSVDKASVEISCESWLRALGRPTHRRRTNRDQQERFANDVGYEYITSIQAMPINWGQSDAEQTKNARNTLKKINRR